MKCRIEGCRAPVSRDHLCFMHLRKPKTLAPKPVPKEEPRESWPDPRGFDVAEAERSKQLWRTVLWQALTDAMEPLPSDFHGRLKTAAVAKAHARAWFSLNNPEFILVCDLASFDPSFIVDRATLAIANHDRIKRMIGGYRQTCHPTKGTGGGRRENSSDFEHERRVIHFGLNNPLRNVEDVPCS